MKGARPLVFGLGSVLVAFLAGTAVTAMASPDTGSDALGDSSATALVMLPLLVLVLLVVIAARLLDLRHRRDDEAAVLEWRIAHALSQDPLLNLLPVTVTAHAPLSCSEPIDVTLIGEASTPAIRDVARQLAERELSQSGVPYRLTDRVAVEERLAA